MTATSTSNQPAAPNTIASKAVNPGPQAAAKAPAKKARTASPKAKPKASQHSPQAASKAAPAKSPSPAPRKAASKAAPTEATVSPSQAAKAKAVKDKKQKVVRDSFTIPKTEFTQIADMKKRAMSLGVEIKKSELIRAGLQVISGLPDASFKKALAAIPTVKTGRPSKA